MFSLRMDTMFSLHKHKNPPVRYFSFVTFYCCFSLPLSRPLYWIFTIRKQMIFFAKRATDIDTDFSHRKQEITHWNDIKKREHLSLFSLTRFILNCRCQAGIKTKSSVQLSFFKKQAKMQLLNSNIPRRAQNTKYSNKKAQCLLNLVLFVFCSFFVLQRWLLR